MNPTVTRIQTPALQTNHTLERGKAFLELITDISLNKRAIAQSIVNQFELYDYNDYKTMQDGKRRHTYRHSIRYLQENGEAWQFIVESQHDNRGYSYLAPNKAGNRAFLPNVPTDIRKAIGARYQINVPLTGNFWQWLAKHRQIPITITEGGGKALSGLSHGFVTIGLFGCSCLSSPDLLPYLKGRDIRIAFDSDIKPSAIKAVKLALFKHLKPLSKLAKSVTVATWESQNKGLDDLLASGGAAAYENAIATGKSADAWVFEQSLEIADQRIDSISTEIELSHEDYKKLDYASLKALTGNARDIFITAFKGAGKTEFAIKVIQEYKTALIPSHRKSLAQSNAIKFGATYRTDCDRSGKDLITSEGYVDKLSFCNESIHSLRPQLDSLLNKGAIVFNDELDQQIESLATSSTHAKDGRRSSHEDAFWNMQMRAKQTLSVSADLTDHEVALFERRTGRKPFVIKVLPVQKDYKALLYEMFPEFWQQFLDAKSQGKRILFLCSRKSDTKFLADTFGAIAVNADNSNDYREFLDTPNDWLAQNNPSLLAVSPVLGTGFSITHDAFDVVFGWFHADNQGAKAMMQFTERYRLPVERHLFCQYSSGRFENMTIEALFKARLALAKANPLNEYEESFIDEQDPYFYYKAKTNWSLAHLRADLLARLKREVKDITYVRSSLCPKVQKAISKKYHKQLKTWRDTYPTTVFEASDLSRSEYTPLKERQDLSEAQRLAVTKFELADWSTLLPDELTLERVKRDRKGRKRKALEHLELQAYPQIAVAIDKASLDKQSKHGAGVSQQDITHNTMRVTALQQLGSYEMLDFALSGATWNSDSPQTIAFANQISSKRDALSKMGIGLTCGKKSNVTAIYGAFLHYFGLKTVRSQRRIAGKVTSFYQLCADDLALTKQDLIARLNRNIERYGELVPTSHAFVDKLYSCHIALVNNTYKEVSDTHKDESPPPKSQKNTEQIPISPPTIVGDTQNNSIFTPSSPITSFENEGTTIENQGDRDWF